MGSLPWEQQHSVLSSLHAQFSGAVLPLPAPLASASSAVCKQQLMLVGQQQNHLQFRLASHQAHEHYNMKDVMMQGMLSEQNALMQQQQIIMLHERMDQIAAQHEQLLKVVAAGIHNVAYNFNQVLTASVGRAAGLGFINCSTCFTNVAVVHGSRLFKSASGHTTTVV